MISKLLSRVTKLLNKESKEKKKVWAREQMREMGKLKGKLILM